MYQQNIIIIITIVHMMIGNIGKLKRQQYLKGYTIR